MNTFDYYEAFVRPYINNLSYDEFRANWLKENEIIARTDKPSYFVHIDGNESEHKSNLVKTLHKTETGDYYWRVVNGNGLTEESLVKDFQDILDYYNVESSSTLSCIKKIANKLKQSPKKELINVCQY